MVMFHSLFVCLPEGILCEVKNYLSSDERPRVQTHRVDGIFPMEKSTAWDNKCVYIYIISYNYIYIYIPRPWKYP